MKKVFAGIFVSAVLVLSGCATETPEVSEISLPELPEQNETVVEHQWVQDLWLFNKVSYFTEDGTEVDVTDDVLNKMARNTPTEEFDLGGGAYFHVFNPLKPAMVNATGVERTDVEVTAGVMKVDEEEVLAILATPDEKAEKPIGVEDFLELDLTFVSGEFEPGVPMSFDFGFVQTIPGNDPADASSLELLKHRLDAEQFNFYGTEPEDGAGGPEMLMFSNVMGEAVTGSTRMNVNGKEKISDPMMEGLRDGVWSSRKGGVGGVKSYFEKFGEGAKKSNELIRCNLDRQCNKPEDPPKKKPKKCRFFCGKVHGDPHLASFDGVNFDMQGIGEFVLVEAPELTVQIRTEPMENSKTISVLTAVAVESNGQTVSVHLGENARELYLNDEAVELSDAEEQETLGDVTVTSSKSEVTIETPGEGLIAVNFRQRMLDLFVDIGKNENITGLLGDADGDPSNDFVTRDGKNLAEDLPFSDAEEFYDTFVNSWRINQDESLFAYLPGESTQSFTDLNFPEEYVSIASVPEKDLRKAKQICEHAGVTLQPFLDHCIFDYWASGNMDFVNSAKQMSLQAGLFTGEYKLADEIDGESDVVLDIDAKDGEEYAEPRWSWHPDGKFLPGDKFKRICPPGGSVKASIWGGGEEGYTSDSAVCPAAVHAGLIDTKHGGTVWVKMVEGQDSYPAAATANNVTPRSWDSPWHGGFVFEK